MQGSEDKQLPQRRPDNPPDTRAFSTHELEAVIRRAVELQAGSSGPSGDGLSETDIVRIGQDLGLETAAVRRAIAEVRGRAPEETGALTKVVGPGIVRASRVVQRSAADVGPILDRYLRETEFMVVQRRFPDRLRYCRDASLAAGFARFARGFSRPHKPLNLSQLDVSVTALDTGSCLVEVSVDMGATRGGIAAGVLGSGGGLTAGWLVTVWATAIADPLMLLAVPALAGSWFGMRAIYGAVSRSAQDKLESLLDRVEHDDLA